MKNEKELVAITNKVKRQIADIDITPPLLYQTLFNNLLADEQIVLEDENLLVDKILEGKLLKLTKLNDNASENILKLDNSTKNAIRAIQNKDDTRLEEILEETADLRREIEKLKSSIFTDTLTKAYNRQWLYSAYMSGAETLTCNGILVFIDMNYFKDINDNYGHIAGDKVLEFTAMHLKKTKGNLVRYGGDEFLLFFNDSYSVKQITDMIENNREQIMKKELRFQEHAFHVGYSYGVTSFKKDDNFQDIFSVADELMYQDKESSKHRLIIG